MKLKSTQVEIFPVAKKRIQVQGGEPVRGTKILTEKNISNIIRQLLGESSPGFVISCTKDSDTTYNISFNLYGYYFNITEFDPSKFGTLASSIYAKIALNESDDEINGQDDKPAGGSDYEYGGLDITDSEPESGIYIKILEKISSNWCPPIANYGFMTSQTIGGIDGKPRA